MLTILKTENNLDALSDPCCTACTTSALEKETVGSSPTARTKTSCFGAQSGSFGVLQGSYFVHGESDIDIHQPVE